MPSGKQLNMHCLSQLELIPLEHNILTGNSIQLNFLLQIVGHRKISLDNLFKSFLGSLNRDLSRNDQFDRCMHCLCQLEVSKLATSDDEAWGPFPMYSRTSLLSLPFSLATMNFLSNGENSHEVGFNENWMLGSDTYLNQSCGKLWYPAYDTIITASCIDIQLMEIDYRLQGKGLLMCDKIHLSPLESNVYTSVASTITVL